MGTLSIGRSSNIPISAVTLKRHLWKGRAMIDKAVKVILGYKVVFHSVTMDLIILLAVSYV